MEEYYGSNYFRNENFGYGNSTPYASDYHEFYPNYVYEAPKFVTWNEPSSCCDAYYYLNQNQSEMAFSVASVSHPEFVELDLDNPDGGNGYYHSKTNFVISYSTFNEDEDVDYDPTPYGGGYDIAQTYGKPLPPSDGICYPKSHISNSPVAFAPLALPSVVEIGDRIESKEAKEPQEKIDSPIDDDGEADDGEADDGETDVDQEYSDDGEADDGETDVDQEYSDDGETDVDQEYSDDGEADDGETDVDQEYSDDGEADDGETDDDQEYSDDEEAKKDFVTEAGSIPLALPLDQEKESTLVDEQYTWTDYGFQNGNGYENENQFGQGETPCDHGELSSDAMGFLESLFGWPCLSRSQEAAVADGYSNCNQWDRTADYFFGRSNVYGYGVEEEARHARTIYGYEIHYPEEVELKQVQYSDESSWFQEFNTCSEH